MENSNKRHIGIKLSWILFSSYGKTIIVIFPSCTLSGKKSTLSYLKQIFAESFYSWARSACRSLKLNSWRISRNATFGRRSSPSSESRNAKLIPSLNNKHTEKQKSVSDKKDLFPIPEIKFTADLNTLVTCVGPLAVHAHDKDPHQSSWQAFSPNLWFHRGPDFLDLLSASLRTSTNIQLFT